MTPSCHLLGKLHLHIFNQTIQIYTSLVICLFVCSCDNFFPTSVESMMITFKLKEKFMNSFSFRQCLVQSHSNSSRWRVTFWGAIKLFEGGGGLFLSKIGLFPLQLARNSSVCF